MGNPKKQSTPDAHHLHAFTHPAKLIHMHPNPASQRRHLRFTRLTLPRPLHPIGSFRAKCQPCSASAR